MRKRFIKWLIRILLPHHHLAKNGPGRRKSIQASAKEYYKKEAEREGIGGEISEDYRTSHLKTSPGHPMGKEMGD